MYTQTRYTTHVTHAHTWQNTPNTIYYFLSPPSGVILKINLADLSQSQSGKHRLTSSHG